MKRFSLIMIIMWSAIGLLIVSVLISGIIFASKGELRPMMSLDNNDRSNLQLVVDETVPIRDIDQVKLEFWSDACNIYVSDSLSTDQIGIKHYVRDLPESRYATATLDRGGNALTVSTRPASFSGFSIFGFSRNPSVVDIYLPKAYKDALNIDLKSGTIRFDGGLDINELSVHVSSGSIRSEHAVKARYADISVTSGTIKLTGGVESENYSIKSSSGTITVDQKLTGSGNVNVTSGSVKLFGVDITESLSVKASSGTISIGIAGNPSLKFNGKKASGTIRTYFTSPSGGDIRTVSATVGEGPYKNLDVSVTSGTVRITQE